ncbi:Isoleucine--tRNA ligase [Cyphellophora attinorum]|uniref:Isoleucine--tRNA ligase, mitochondrial n=1 Tax=Cyphellophora attinorum TaxID=1664694 RepID=A0A0N1HCD1_9EURO|nr:Isoleucine--tRNA ligase [Phialophora attinorum]KPI46093.1 Isoleucine--tRNA ligase [Phialophora attinorum]
MTEAAKQAAKFLKSTLRLPVSTFPARAPPQDIAKYLPRCTDDLYAWQRQARTTSPTFTLHDGPPYANGDLHVGHALNKILKDIICRTKLSQGNKIDYVPGWDCHGLPIELKALEKHGWQRGEGKDPVAIRKAARNFALKAVEKQMKGFKAWGVMADWEGHWKTMDKSFELRQLQVFRDMVEKGLIYRKHKPVYWSPSSGTALAEAELEYKEDHVSTAAYVKFQLDNSKPGDGPLHALIWTTTPWTLPANQAIAVHRDLAYCVVKSARHGRLVIAEARKEAVEKAIGEDLSFEKVFDPAELLESSYHGHSAFRPFSLNRPIVHADFVSADSGTGLVHCAPGHGMDDYLALSDHISAGRVVVRAPVGDLGRFDATATPEKPDLLAGLQASTEGNKAVLDLLRESNALVHHASYQHKYPIDWRTKEPIMIRATAQWFADLSSIRSDALAALGNVRFIPESGKSRLRSFVESRTEWCISRQRSWGVPIPAFYHRETGEAVLSASTVDHVIRVMDERGTNAWWADGPDEPAWLPEGLEPSDYVRGTDTMDVWFDSGTSWKFMTAGSDAAGSQQQPVADVYLEGTDQHRGWFQSSLLTAVAAQKASGITTDLMSAPFETLLTHGFTLDAHGKKMSKSLGNVVSPDEIITGLATSAAVPPSPPSTKKKSRENHSLGPDALRLWVASTDFTKDVTISDKVVKSTHSALDKLRVTFKVLLGMLGPDFDPTAGLLPFKDLAQLDQLMHHRLFSTIEQVRSAYDKYEFHRGIALINKFVATDLSGLYLESVKDIIYCDAVNSPRRKSAVTTLYDIFASLQELLAPVLPLLVEETWEHSSAAVKADAERHPLRRTRSNLEAKLEQWKPGASSAELWSTLNLINSTTKAAQEVARNQKKLGQSLASDVVIYVKPPERCDFAELIKEVIVDAWRELLVVSDVRIVIADRPDFQEDDKNPSSWNNWLKEMQDAEEDDEDGSCRSVELEGGKTVGWRVTRKIGCFPEVEAVVVVQEAGAGKCARCWRYLVSSPELEPEGKCGERVTRAEGQGDLLEDVPLCARCVDVVQHFREG